MRLLVTPAVGDWVHFRLIFLGPACFVFRFDGGAGGPEGVGLRVGGGGVGVRVFVGVLVRVFVRVGVRVGVLDGGVGVPVVGGCGVALA